MKTKLLSLSFLFSLFFFSCVEPLEIKEPVDVSFNFDIEEQSERLNYLKFKSGKINISEFSFEGKREQGKEVFFSNQYKGGIEIEFDESRGVKEFQFQIPQGVYTKTEISFRTLSENLTENSHSIYLEGVFIHNENGRPADDYKKNKVIVEIDSDQFFTCIGKSAEGDSQVVLSNDKPVSASVKVDVMHWFQVVPYLLLKEVATENDSLETVNSTEDILINKEENVEIYQLIIGRISESANITFR